MRLLGSGRARTGARAPLTGRPGKSDRSRFQPTLFLPEAQDISPLDLRAPASSSGHWNEPPRGHPPTSEAIELDCAGVDLKRSRIEPERLFRLRCIAPPILFRAAARNVGVCYELLGKGPRRRREVRPREPAGQASLQAAAVRGGGVKGLDGQGRTPKWGRAEARPRVVGVEMCGC